MISGGGVKVQGAPDAQAIVLGPAGGHCQRVLPGNLDSGIFSPLETMIAFLLNESG
jgi:hypothetical protein